MVSPRREPTTTGLYWNLHDRRGTGDLSQIIVMDQCDDPWLQDPVFKRFGETRPGESALALINRYRAEMVRRTEADPAQAGKKGWVETSAAYAITLDKRWTRHRQTIPKKPPAQ